MSFDYNPSDKTENEGGRAEPGVYPFVVDQITETVFRSGNSGWKVELMVGAFPDRDIRVFDNMVNTPNALWKFEQFCQAFGFDFTSPPPGGWKPEQFIGKQGTADFEMGDRGYLQVKFYSAASANNGPDARKPAGQPAHIEAAGSDNVPF